ncbi:uncharacterized protein VTP21DRAFT_6009 [Calcarisporiella thermophila]|uniref:uncharacterized protein n=1 Tax=Calcarisporiella thermophila TaxID=911321 RepID=UPI0037444F5F
MVCLNYFSLKPPENFSLFSIPSLLYIMRLLLLGVIAFFATTACAFDLNLWLALLRSQLTLLNQQVFQDRRIPVDLFVMSKCPDAALCEATFSKVIESSDVPVELNLRYIAVPDESRPFGGACLHGDTECLGNIQELCFHDSCPKANWLNFVRCMNEQRELIGTTDEIPRNCSERMGYSYGPVRDCTLSPRGKELFKKSMQFVIDKGVRYSCTVFIDNEYDCMVDSGKWQNCRGGSTVQDFVDRIRRAARK